MHTIWICQSRALFECSNLKLLYITSAPLIHPTFVFKKIFKKGTQLHVKHEFVNGVSQITSNRLIGVLES
jgi:hypothetical protein